MLVHRALGKISAGTKAKIGAVVTFGDPLKNAATYSGVDKSKTKIICVSGDMVCSGTAIILPAHLTYGSKAGEAATFIKSQIP
jgi:cutinase